MRDDPEFERRARAVAWFSAEMMRKLERDLRKGDWEKDSSLLSGLLAELAEMCDALGSGTPAQIVQECADVANFALMIADKARRKE